MRINPSRVPAFVHGVSRKLQKAGFAAYLVGGAVRDLAGRKTPHDWDIATNAKPSQTQRLFPGSILTGKRFGTITVQARKRKFVEVTTFRKEGKYRDHRHPEGVEFVETIGEDLQRRDFTINAMALDLRSGKVMDPFKGLKDLRDKKIKTVGKPLDRFREDALRILRAARFSSQLAFHASQSLEKAASSQKRAFRDLSAERIQQEFSKLLLGQDVGAGIYFLRKTGILECFLPELMEGWRISQGGWHDYDVFHHTLRVIEKSPKDLVLRLAALLHDIAKPRCRIRDGNIYRFTGHEKLGEEMSQTILKRLKYSKAVQKSVLPLVRHHLFTEKDILSSQAALRRFIRRVGIENIPNLLLLRKADVRGCGPRRRIPKDLSLLENALKKEINERRTLNLSSLAVDGSDIMKILKIDAGPRVGEVLEMLLEMVLEDPRLNTRKNLLREVRNNALR